MADACAGAMPPRCCAGAPEATRLGDVLLGAHIWSTRVGHRYARLGQACLRCAPLGHAALELCAWLHLAHLSHAHLSHACLELARLSHARLQLACLSHALLSHTHPSRARLEHACFSHARLRHACLELARLCHAHLSHAPLGHAHRGPPRGSAAVGCSHEVGLPRVPQGRPHTSVDTSPGVQLAHHIPEDKRCLPRSNHPWDPESMGFACWMSRAGHGDTGSTATGR